LLDAAAKEGITIPHVGEFESVSGGGLIGNVAGRRVIVGSAKFLRQHGIEQLQTLAEGAADRQAQGNGVIFVAIDGRAAGIIAVADQIKQTAPAAIDHLHRLGIKIIMLTGDNERTARSVAQQLGIDEVEAGVAPQQKNERVRALRNKTNVVAMAGDGIK
jgi:Cu+-exporting ATPase